MRIGCASQNHEANGLFMNFQHLADIRASELIRVLSAIPSGSRVLEIGAGAGWQAKALADAGFLVSAIDIVNGGYEHERVWTVNDYDGSTIPFPDDSFDVVFTSNVLEHIPHVESFQAEIHRVLSPNGRAVHVLPTASWRIWTSLSHYLYVGRVAMAALLPAPERSRDVDAVLGKARRMPLARKLGRALFPPRHGEFGNTISEVYTFSRFRWRALFERTGWRLEAVFPAGLFYTGYSVAGSGLGIATRARLSRVLGSSCLVYVLRNQSDSNFVHGRVHDQPVGPHRMPPAQGV